MGVGNMFNVLHLFNTYSKFRCALCVQLIPDSKGAAASVAVIITFAESCC